MKPGGNGKGLSGGQDQILAPSPGKVVPMAPGMRPPRLQRTVKMSLLGLPNLAACLEPILNLGLSLIKEVTGGVLALVSESSQTAGLASEWVNG